MDKSQNQTSNKQKVQKQIRRQNVLEAVRDIGTSTVDQAKNELLKKSAMEFMNQIMGRMPKKHFSGEMEPGKPIVMNDVKTGKQEANDKLKKQLGFERKMREEEKIVLERKSNDLKLELHAITTEIAKLAYITPKLSREVQVASIQAPANPGVYHVLFF